MKIEALEKTLEQIREREDYLINLKKKSAIDACYFKGRGYMLGEYRQLFTLNEEEKEYLKASCITEIKRLKKSIECLTD